MIEAAGGKAALHIADVTDPKAVAAMVDATVKRFGRIDILVNNAAVRDETPFDEITLEEWRQRDLDRARRRVPVRAGLPAASRRAPAAARSSTSAA